MAGLDPAIHGELLKRDFAGCASRAKTVRRFEIFPAKKNIAGAAG